MSYLFFCLFAFSAFSLFAGLINPRLVIRWGRRRTRKTVLNIYGPLSLVFFILIGFAANDTTRQQRQNTVAANFQTHPELVDKVSSNETRSVPSETPEQAPPSSLPTPTRFRVSCSINVNSLEVILDTNLPEETVVMISVSRSYKEKGSTQAYSLDYLSEESDVRKWRSKQIIPIETGKWLQSLKAKQEQMSRIGLGFDVGSISDKIDLRLVVPATDPAGFRVAAEEIDYPIGSALKELSPLPSLDPLNLDLGQRYLLSKETPLMPSHDPDRPLEALKKMKRIPNNGTFEVLEKIEKASSNWYRVNAFTSDGIQFGTGWINSTALLGQEVNSTK